MNLQGLYAHTQKMLNDNELSVQDKCSLLEEWRRKTEAKIGTTILSSAGIKDAQEFLAYLSLRASAFDNASVCSNEQHAVVSDSEDSL